MTPAPVPVGSLTRPRGYFPRGTSLGFAGLAALSVGVPFSVLEVAAPATTGGFDRWLDSIPYVLGFGLLPVFVLIFGLRSRRYWVVCLFYYSGVALLLAYAFGVVFALACLAGLLPVREPGLGAMTVVGLGLLLLLSPAAWFLRRALRLRYWQPRSTPAQWEPGDEGPPAWALSPKQRDGR